MDDQNVVHYSTLFSFPPTTTEIIDKSTYLHVFCSTEVSHLFFKKIKNEHHASSIS